VQNLIIAGVFITGLVVWDAGRQPSAAARRRGLRGLHGQHPSAGCDCCVRRPGSGSPGQPRQGSHAGRGAPVHGHGVPGILLRDGQDLRRRPHRPTRRTENP
jgi:hypothetical protein